MDTGAGTGPHNQPPPVPPAAPTDLRPDSPSAHAVAARARARLDRLCQLIRTVLTAHRLALFLTGGLVALATVIAIDYALWLPAWARVIALTCFIAGGVVYARKWLVPALRFRPHPEQLALRLERTTAGQRAGLAGVLASGVGLSAELEVAPAHSSAELDRLESTRQLAAPVVLRAGELLEHLPLRSVINLRPAVASLGVLGAGVLAGLALLVTHPTLSLIGLERALIPITSAAWPKTQDLRDVTGVRVHAMGQALPLRAALVKGAGVGPGGAADPAAMAATQIVTNWRLIRAGTPGPIRSLGASFQGRSVDVPARDDLDTLREPAGALFERLLEPATLAAELAGQPPAPTARVELEYWFAGERDRTEPTRVELVPPPAVVGAKVRVEPPTYAPGLAVRSINAGAGDDERAMVSGVLPGSVVTLELTYNKPVPTSWLNQAPGQAPVPTLADQLGPEVALLSASEGAGFNIKLSEAREGPHAVMTWRHTQTLRVRAAPTDEHGLGPITPGVFVIELRQDKPPEAVVTSPAMDTQALPTAKLELAGQATDDVELRFAELRVQVAQTRADSAGAAAEPIGEDRTLARAAPGPDEPHATSTRAATLLVGAPIDLGELDLKPGQELWVTVLAKDTFSLEGQEHEPVRSPVRKVRIISPDQLLEQLWGDLSGVRRQVQRLSERQGELAALTQRSADASRAAREQPELAEQIARAEGALARVRENLTANALTDEEMADVLRDARAALEQARAAAAQAGTAAQEQQRQRAANDQPAAERSRAQAAAQQEKAQRALEQAAEALDRGQDTWAARRSIERLIADQQALRERAAELGRAHAGQQPEQLPEGAQRAVRELAEQQEQLARRADEAIRKLEQRAEQAQRTDPAAAEALREAARQGRQGGASDQMQQAARSARQNQQQAAQQSQQKAEQALARTLAPLQDQAKARDAVLRRTIASLVEAIDALIAQQTRATAALSLAMPAGPFAGLDGPMIRLHTGTISAAQQARDAGRALRAVAVPLDNARDEQMMAITALRAQPADAATALLAQQASLAKLQEAKRLAQEADQQAAQRQQARQRAELAKSYEQALAEQATLRAQAQPLAGQQLDRRSRNTARALAEAQEALLTRLATLREGNKDLADAQVFSLAHRRIADAGERVVEGLREQTVPQSLPQRQQTIERVLRQLVSALGEDQQPDEPFREPENAGGGGGGGSSGSPPLIPPVAQLKLLRAMQEEALELTRQADQLAAGPDKANAAQLTREARELQAQVAQQAQTLLQSMQPPSLPENPGPPARRE